MNEAGLEGEVSWVKVGRSVVNDLSSQVKVKVA
jgi:hypothetical protein